jgi:polyisoprenyl-teichoic acid--peptidoglycan teichoic acid transferase
MTASTASSSRTHQGRRRRVLVALTIAWALVIAGLVADLQAGAADPAFALYATDSDASGVDTGGEHGDVVWVLAVGSDARPGEPITRSRGDAIQLIGVNTSTGHGVVLGIPRDSYVPIPGHGSNKINAALAYGGPDLMARTVGDLVRLQPDFVFVTGFLPFTKLVNDLGGLRIDVPKAVDSPSVQVKAGSQTLAGHKALMYARARHGVPGGDFGRSLHQGAELTAMLAQLRKADPRHVGGTALGMLRQGIAVKTSPAQAFRLYQAAMAADPSSFRHCVFAGGFGMAGSASIVVVNRPAVRRVMADVRSDATLSGACPPGQP